MGEPRVAMVVQQKEIKDGVTRPYIKAIDFPPKIVIVFQLIPFVAAPFRVRIDAQAESFSYGIHYSTTCWWILSIEIVRSIENFNDKWSVDVPAAT